MNQLQIELNKVRLQRTFAGTFNMYDTNDLAEELRGLEDKCERGTPLHRLLYVQPFAITTFELWMTVLESEK